MSWLGAGIGASIGFVIGGPIGAGIGLWIGSSVSNKNYARIKPSMQQQSQTLFFVSLFSMLAKMAKADGIIVKDEINAVNLFMKSIALDKEDRNAAINIFRNAALDSYSIYDYATQYKEIANKEMREMIYNMLWNVAYSDGVIYKNEDDILKKIPGYLGLNNGIYNEYNARFSKNTHQTSVENINTCYRLLGCNKDSSDSEVKKCYKRAIAEHHPDKIQSKGLPKEFIKFANEQSKKINKAYDAIKQERKL